MFKTILIGSCIAALFGCAPTNQGFVKNLVFSGDTIRDRRSGLIVVPAGVNEIVGITSYYGDFNVILPYDKWVININNDYPLLASSEKGTVSVMFEAFDGSPKDHLNDIKKRLSEMPYGSDVKFEFRTYKATDVLVTSVDVGKVLMGTKGYSLDSKGIGIQTGVYSVKLKSDGTHAVYHYSHIDGVPQLETSLQQLIKYATTGFTPNFKENLRAAK